MAFRPENLVEHGPDFNIDQEELGVVLVVQHTRRVDQGPALFILGHFEKKDVDEALVDLAAAVILCLLLIDRSLAQECTIEESVRTIRTYPYSDPDPVPILVKKPANEPTSASVDRRDELRGLRILSRAGVAECKRG